MIIPNKIKYSILGLAFIFSSCSESENSMVHSKMAQGKISAVKFEAEKNTISKDSTENQSKFSLEDCYSFSQKQLDKQVYYTDTVVAKTSQELIDLIASNRLIKLLDKTYIFEPLGDNRSAQGLVIEGIKNLKIIGTRKTEILVQNSNALKISNAYNISLNKMSFRQGENQVITEGIAAISHAYNIDISQCKLIGPGTFGIITTDVNQFNFVKSEITGINGFIFELAKSVHLNFKDSKFHNNALAASVLGGFTESTRIVNFSHCSFLNNLPDQAGNPAFNFMENYSNFNEPIVFSNCTFKNNKGYKWYGDKIKLVDCQVDSTDFIGF